MSRPPARSRLDSDVMDGYTQAHRLQSLLDQTAALHQHLCPRQVLGVRMGLFGGRLLNLDLPQEDEKRLYVFMETDGCGADGVSVATGCRVGRRTMRIVDFGKLAATLVDRRSERAYRVRPHLESRRRAGAARPDEQSRWQAMLEGYQVLPDDQLLSAQRVELVPDLEDLISTPEVRVNCQSCGEEVINERQVEVGGRVLCRACAGEAYYRVVGRD